MRPRKERLPLTLDSLTALMIPGKSYTAAKLSCIFDASPAAIHGLLTTLEAAGKLTSSTVYCGRTKDLREDRRIYSIPANTRADVAQRRTGPAEMPGELQNYDLGRFQRLAMASRR